MCAASEVRQPVGIGLRLDDGQPARVEALSRDSCPVQPARALDEQVNRRHVRHHDVEVEVEAFASITCVATTMPRRGRSSLRPSSRLPVSVQHLRLEGSPCRQAGGEPRHGTASSSSCGTIAASRSVSHYILLGAAHGISRLPRAQPPSARLSRSVFYQGLARVGIQPRQGEVGAPGRRKRHAGGRFAVRGQVSWG